MSARSLECSELITPAANLLDRGNLMVCALDTFAVFAQTGKLRRVYVMLLGCWIAV